MTWSIFAPALKQRGSSSQCGTLSWRTYGLYWRKLGVVLLGGVHAGIVALTRYAVSGRFSFPHPPHGSICFGSCGLNPSPLHATNPLFHQLFFRANPFGDNRLAHGPPRAYMYAVRYITIRRPHAHSEEGNSPTEAPSRFSRREAHPTPAHRRFQIHFEPFQPTFCCAENPEKERPR